MGKKKKKMTPAQAASARKEQTESSRKHAMAKERGKLIKESAENAQKKAQETAGFRMLMPIILIALIIISAIAITMAPGMLMGK